MKGQKVRTRPRGPLEIGGRLADVRLLESGYWHIRLGPERFAQFPFGAGCRREDCFPEGWWTDEEIEAITSYVRRLEYTMRVLNVRHPHSHWPVIVLI